MSLVPPYTIMVEQHTFPIGHRYPLKLQAWRVCGRLGRSFQQPTAIKNLSLLAEDTVNSNRLYTSFHYIPSLDCFLFIDHGFRV